MITPGADSQKLCDTCQNTGVTRQFYFTSTDGKYERFVVYDTHFPAIETEAHMQAMQRMNAFLQQACDFFDSVQTKVSEIKPPQGKIHGVDFETVQPTACEVRSEFVLVVQIKFMEESTTFRIGPVKLSEITVESLVDQTQELLTQSSLSVTPPAN